MAYLNVQKNAHEHLSNLQKSSALIFEGSGLFQCDEWIINSHHNTLTKGDLVYPLTYRLVSLLLYIAQRSGHIVAKEELLDGLWGRRIVGDDSLAVAISQLRKTMGDDPKNPTYIKTIPRVGYLFLKNIHPI